MSEKCNCYEEKMKLLKPKIMEKIPNDATDIDIRWDGYSFFTGGDYNPVNAGIKVEYRGIKKSGEPKANLTKFDTYLTFDFCPFCGRVGLSKSSKSKENSRG